MGMRSIGSLAAIAVLVASAGYAQHDHGHGGMGATPAARDSVPAAPAHESMPMASAILPGVPMSRDGSGTSWLPDASPVHAAHRMSGDWAFMVHGNAFARYTTQNIFADGGERSADDLDAPDWIMASAQRAVGASDQVAVRAMLSLDRPIGGGDGYPLLFQTGETWNDLPLIDRQHPHDLVAELAAMGGHAFGPDAGAFVYLGYPGEPALGAPTFMHRPSAMENPDAPLGHHWQDATHITFGVATLGARWRRYKIEGSLFTGREPDEERYGFDKPRFDSWSVRLSANPSDRIAVQASYGFLESPEVLEPGIDQHRLSASAIAAVPLGRERNWMTSVVWGMSRPKGQDDQHSLLAESACAAGRWALYGRGELVWKPGEELGAAALGHDLVLVNALTLGCARTILAHGGLDLRFGAQGTVSRTPDELAPYYGDWPVSAEVYLRLSPAHLARDGHAAHGMSP